VAHFFQFSRLESVLLRLPHPSRCSKGGIPTAWLDQRLDVLPDPIEDLPEPQFVPIYEAVDELEPFLARDVDVKTIATQEDIGGGESDALVAVKEAVIIAERLLQRRRFFFLC
jgi:hypothetical protein